LAGRTVKGINVSGLSDQSRADLLNQLPVHEGDAYSREILENVTRVVKGFDEHLSITVKSAAGGFTLEIVAPDSVRTPGRTMTAATSTDTKRIMVGGAVQQRKLVSQVRPVYPPEAKAARITGAVKLSALIGKDGSIQNLDVISGEPVLVQSALDAVKQWVYQPTLLNGQPVEVLTEIDLNYSVSQ
jgi:TonB family protein